MSDATATVALPRAIGTATSAGQPSRRIDWSRRMPVEAIRTPTAPRRSATRAAEEAEIDPRFIRHRGFLIFAGEVSPDAIPDHRAIRDERIDALVADADAGRL